MPMLFINARDRGASPIPRQLHCDRQTWWTAFAPGGEWNNGTMVSYHGNDIMVI